LVLDQLITGPGLANFSLKRERLFAAIKDLINAEEQRVGNIRTVDRIMEEDFAALAPAPLLPVPD
jgi:hypothetical protein